LCNLSPDLASGYSDEQGGRISKTFGWKFFAGKDMDKGLTPT